MDIRSLRYKNSYLIFWINSLKIYQEKRFRSCSVTLTTIPKFEIQNLKHHVLTDVVSLHFTEY